MCSSKAKLQETTVSHINGRPVLQPNCNNRSTLLERRKKTLKKSSSLPTIRSPSTITPILSPSPTTTTPTPPISPKLKSPRPPAIKRGNAHNDPNGLNSSNEKIPLAPKTKTLVKKKSKKLYTLQTHVCQTSLGQTSLAAEDVCPTFKYSSSSLIEAPGSIAAARREQVANMQVQRKMRIAHYGRTKSANFERNNVDVALVPIANARDQETRCNSITINSDPIYVAYHDEEWGVPVHDDTVLFELLMLSGAQLGSDWTSVLKKRQAYRDTF
ncbi:hypothetical protein Leryth_027395 [Lithospermum erythrorhizon]|nr:hypothetical protein Leryth_027395 [Lithospermum erythrorhizon]